MADRQAAEARERHVVAIRAVLDYPDREFGPKYRAALDALDALARLAQSSDALSVRLAQAEQKRDEWKRDYMAAIDSQHEDLAHEVKVRERAEVRLREYEEALKRYENEAPDWLKPIARAALAASGGREAPDTKEPAGG